MPRAAADLPHFAAALFDSTSLLANFPPEAADGAKLIERLRAQGKNDSLIVSIITGAAASEAQRRKSIGFTGPLSPAQQADQVIRERNRTRLGAVMAMSLNTPDGGIGVDRPDVTSLAAASMADLEEPPGDDEIEAETAAAKSADDKLATRQPVHPKRTVIPPQAKFAEWLATFPKDSPPTMRNAEAWAADKHFNRDQARKLLRDALQPKPGRRKEMSEKTNVRK